MKVRIHTLGSFTKSFCDEFIPFYNETRKKFNDSRIITKLWCDRKNIKLYNCELPQTKIGKIAGRTSEQWIVIDFHHEYHPFNFYIFFHEYAHYYLHFTKAGSRIPHGIKEQEADAFACMICNILFPGNYDKIIEFAKGNPTTNLTNTQRMHALRESA